MDRMSETLNLELGLTLSMLPMAFVYGIIERTLVQFWRLLGESMNSLPQTEERKFIRGLMAFRQHYFMFYLAGLILLSAVLLGGFILLINTGLIKQWLPGSDMGIMLFFLETGLIAFGFIGLGVYNLTYCITLANLRPATLSVSWGILVILATGIPLSYFDFRWASFGFIAGSLTFAIVSWREVNRVLKSTAYHMAFTV
jgi:hypothetical protein